MERLYHPLLSQEHRLLIENLSLIPPKAYIGVYGRKHLGLDGKIISLLEPINNQVILDPLVSIHPKRP